MQQLWTVKDQRRAHTKRSNVVALVRRRGLYESVTRNRAIVPHVCSSTRNRPEKLRKTAMNRACRSQSCTSPRRRTTHTPAIVYAVRGRKSNDTLCVAWACDDRTYASSLRPP